jgi:hypothetical protein
MPFTSEPLEISQRPLLIYPGKSTILSYLSGKADFGKQSTTFLARSGGSEELMSTFFISPDNIIFIEVASVLSGAAAVEMGMGLHGSTENATIVSLNFEF